MENWLILILLVLIIGGRICFILARKSSNRKEAQSGEDKERVRKAAESLLGADGNYQMIYAHWEEQESYGRAVRTTYYRYVVTYQGQTLCVAPLQIDKKTRQMQVGQPMVFTPENLGKVTVRKKQKDGGAEHMEIWLGDKQGHKIIQLYMDAENLRKNRWYPVNIMQQEECAAFERFMVSLEQHVAAENPGVDALIKAENNEGTGIFGAGISIVGAFFGIFFPPLGIVLCLIGLILSIISKQKGAKGKKALIITIICAIWSVGFLCLYLMYLI